MSKTENKDLMKELLQEAGRMKQQEEERGSFDKIDWFKPEWGDNLVRVLPHPKNPKKGWFFKEVHLHFIPFQKKDGTMTAMPARCLTDFEEDCPLCIAHAKVAKKDAIKANQLRRTTRFLYNIVNYKDKKVQPFAAPYTVHKLIMDWLVDVGQFWDIDEGRDVVVVKSKKAGKPAGLNVEYNVRPAMKTSAVPEKLRPLFENAKDFEELYTSNEKERMEEFLGHKSSEVDDEDDEQERREARESKRRITEAKEIEEDEEENEVKKSTKSRYKDEEDDEEGEEEKEEPLSKKGRRRDQDESGEDDELSKTLREIGAM